MRTRLTHLSKLFPLTVLWSVLAGAIILAPASPPAYGSGALVSLQPSNQFSATGGSVSFTVQFSEPGTIQWQVSVDDGVNWDPNLGHKASVSQDGQTLRLSGVTSDMDEYRYRAVLNPDSPLATSDQAVLRVSESQMFNIQYGYSHIEVGKQVPILFNGRLRSDTPTNNPALFLVPTVYGCFGWFKNGEINVETDPRPGNTSWATTESANPGNIDDIRFGAGVYQFGFWTNRLADLTPVNQQPTRTSPPAQNDTCLLRRTETPDILSNSLTVLPPGELVPSSQTITATTGTALTPTSPLVPNASLPSEITPTLDITPALPAGLTFDAATGAITGTPVAVQPPTTYTITAVSRADIATRLDLTKDPQDSDYVTASVNRIVWDATAEVTIEVSLPTTPEVSPPITPSSGSAAVKPPRKPRPQVTVDTLPAPSATTVPTITPRPSQAPNLDPVSQPVLQSGSTFDPNAPTRGSVAGRQTGLQISPESAERLDVRAGAFQFGVSVRPGAGEIQTDTLSRSPELFVPRGQSAALQGGGSFPGSFVQVWLAGSDSRELARFPVGPDGLFAFDFSLDSGPLDMPVPIGRQVLQVVGYDEAGNQTVVDMTINIGQGVPAPEPNREAGTLPTLAFGQSLATSGGIPERVSLTGLPDTGTVAVEGDGWLISVTASRDNGVVENSDGNVLVRLNQSSVGLTEGRGFLAGTLATVWLFSDPTLVSTVTVDEDGQFAAEFLVDARLIAPGEHTLQVQGVGYDGYIKAANLGVLVEQPMAVTSESASSMLFWILGLLLLALVIVFWFVIARRRGNQEV